MASSNISEHKSYLLEYITKKFNPSKATSFKQFLLNSVNDYPQNRAETISILANMIFDKYFKEIKYVDYHYFYDFRTKLEIYIQCRSLANLFIHSLQAEIQILNEGAPLKLEDRITRALTTLKFMLKKQTRYYNSIHSNYLQMKKRANEKHLKQIEVISELNSDLTKLISFSKNRKSDEQFYSLLSKFENQLTQLARNKKVDVGLVHNIDLNNPKIRIITIISTISIKILQIKTLREEKKYEELDQNLENIRNEISFLQSLKEEIYSNKKREIQEKYNNNNNLLKNETDFFNETIETLETLERLCKNKDDLNTETYSKKHLEKLLYKIENFEPYKTLFPTKEMKLSYLKNLKFITDAKKQGVISYDFIKVLYKI